MLELHAALSLAKLARDQRRIADANSLLRPLDEWFQEGRDTPEVSKARDIGVAWANYVCLKRQP
jgi:hypothetical protein